MTLMDAVTIAWVAACAAICTENLAIPIFLHWCEWRRKRRTRARVWMQ